MKTQKKDIVLIFNSNIMTRKRAGITVIFALSILRIKTFQKRFQTIIIFTVFFNIVYGQLLYSCMIKNNVMIPINN